MLKLITNNDNPTIGWLRMRRNATTPIEADEIFSENTEGRIISIDVNKMPFTELISEIPKEEQPTLKNFRAGEAFRLAVYNFSADDEVPLVGFSIEKAEDNKDIYIEGSKSVIDPSKSGLTTSAIAVVPLLHLFNKQIHMEAKRAANLIGKSSGNLEVTSLTAERYKRMMQNALTATENVMRALYGDEYEERKCNTPKTGVDCITEKLHQTLDASSSFYDALINRTSKVFEPSIRTLAEKVALDTYSYK